MTVSIIDVIAVAFIVFFAAMGIRKGLFKIALNLMTYVVAAVASRLLATPVSSFIYTNFFHGKIIDRLKEIIPKSGDALTTVKGTLSPKIVRIADFFNIFPDETQLARFDEALSPVKIEADVIMPLLSKILLIISTVILFFVLCFILKLIVNGLDKHLFKRKKKGVFSKANQVFGMIFGIIKALIPTGLVCMALNLIAPVLNVGFLTDAVSKSFICTFIAGIIK